jgi:hypothetical protein
VPALPEVRARLIKLKETRGDSVAIVNYERTGRPFDEDQFSKKAAIVREADGIPDHLQLRDLRRTGITETRAGGATDHELQATSGNDLESLQIYSVPSNAEAASAIRSPTPPPCAGRHVGSSGFREWASLGVLEACRARTRS